MKFEIDYIEKLAEIVANHELTEICLEDGERAITVRKEKEIVQVAQAAAVQTVAPAAPAASTEAKAEKAKAPASKGIAVTAPMVGTFYKSPNPTSAPFVEVGQTVNKGQVVCIIEAMKLMNEIESEVSGKVVEICVQDGEPVEYGQVLMYVE
jgi:acetyl-CoA carboxylase biotin carboxyl carrier protein